MIYVVFDSYGEWAEEYSDWPITAFPTMDKAVECVRNLLTDKENYHIEKLFIYAIPEEGEIAESKKHWSIDPEYIAMITGINLKKRTTNEARCD